MLVPGGIHTPLYEALDTDFGTATLYSGTEGSSLRGTRARVPLRNHDNPQHISSEFRYENSSKLQNMETTKTRSNRPAKDLPGRGNSFLQFSASWRDLRFTSVG